MYINNCTSLSQIYNTAISHTHCAPLPPQKKRKKSVSLRCSPFHEVFIGIITYSFSHKFLPPSYGGENIVWKLNEKIDFLKLCTDTLRRCILRDENLLHYTLHRESLTLFPDYTEKNSAMSPASTHTTGASKEDVRAGPLRAIVFHHSKWCKSNFYKYCNFLPQRFLVLSCGFLAGHFLSSEVEMAL